VRFFAGRSLPRISRHRGSNNDWAKQRSRDSDAIDRLDFRQREELYAALDAWRSPFLHGCERLKTEVRGKVSPL
jgi:hypothetical protein